MNSKSFLNWLKDIWKDPVLSKVISAGIIAAIVYLTPFKVSIVNILYKFLYIKIDMWKIIAVCIPVAILIYIRIIVLKGYRIRKNKFRTQTTSKPTSSAKFIKPNKDGSLIQGIFEYKIECSVLPAPGSQLWLCVEVLKEAWFKEPLVIDTDNTISGRLGEGAQEFLLSVIELDPNEQMIAKKWLETGKRKLNNYEALKELQGARVADILLKRI